MNTHLNIWNKPVYGRKPVIIILNFRYFFVIGKLVERITIVSTKIHENESISSNHVRNSNDIDSFLLTVRQNKVNL